MSFITDLYANLRQHPGQARIQEVTAQGMTSVDGTTLLEMVGRVRGFLAAASVQAGDRVAVVASNSARWVAFDLAALAHGAIVVPLYDRQDPNELAVMLRSAEPKALIVGNDELEESLSRAWHDRDEARIATFDQVFAHAPLLEAEASNPVEVSGDAIVTIIYTSGTSGEPKGVMLSRSNIDAMIPRTRQRLREVVGDQSNPDRVFHFLPLCFAASRLLVWTQLSRPNPVMLSSDLTQLVQEMAVAKPNYFLNVPAVLERIRRGVDQKIEERGGLARALYARGQRAYRASKTGRLDWRERATLALASRVVFAKIRQQIGPNLKFLICGSAPLSEETQHWFHMLGIPVYQAYGLTETTGIVSIDRAGAVAPGRVGHVIDGVEAKLSDEGELMVRGPNVFAGYWRRPEETAKVMQNGWFRTGDQVDLDRGSLKIIGRMKNLIIPESGHNVAPEPIEERFLELCPAAEHGVVIGHARPWLSLIVTGDPPANAVERAVEELNRELPFYRRIRHTIHAPEKLTPESGLLTANQKLRRAAIESHFRERIDAAYAQAQA